MLNNISVGVARASECWSIIGLLVFVPDDHQSFSFVFGERINNSGLHDGSTGGLGFWFLVLPIGFLLAMYTQTGYDASAHTAEETQNAAIAAAQGVWRSVFFSAADRLVRAARLPVRRKRRRGGQRSGRRLVAIFTSALDSWAAKLVILIAMIGQIFCVAAGMTSASRTWYAFSRDRAMPGWNVFRRVNRDKVPFNAVIAVSFFSLADHDPGAVRQERRARSPSSRSPGSAPSASTSPTSSPSTCGCGQATPSSPGPGTWAAATSWSTSWRSSSWSWSSTPSTCPTRRRAALERRLRHQPRQLHAAGDPDAADLRRLVPGLGQEHATTARSGRWKKTKSRGTFDRGRRTQLASVNG